MAREWNARERGALELAKKITRAERQGVPDEAFEPYRITWLPGSAPGMPLLDVCDCGEMPVVFDDYPGFEGGGLDREGKVMLRLEADHVDRGAYTVLDESAVRALIINLEAWLDGEV